MYWEPYYFWQDEPFERRWCLECMTCEQLTNSDEGAGCYERDYGSATCYPDDQLWIQSCNGVERPSGNAIFNVITTETGDSIKVKGTNLCLTRVKPRFINLQTCSDNNPRQLWAQTLSMDQPFDLRPADATEFGDEPFCVTQHHHPKQYEIITMKTCRVAHKWNTGLWILV